MKKITFLIAVFAVAGIANANLLTNGDFEGAGAGWSQWWGGNSNKDVADPIEGDKCGGVWWSDDGIFQGFAIDAGKYEFGGQIMSTQGMVDRRAVIVAEVGAWNPDKWGPGIGGIDVWWTQELALLVGDPANEWKTPTGSTVIDNTAAGATYLNINLFLINEGSAPSGIAFFDNVWVEKIPEPATMALLGLGALLLKRRK